MDLEPAKRHMIQRQLRRRGICDRRVLAAMMKVPRERFIDPQSRDEAYADRALGIACGQTISQPYIVALMTQSLELSGSEKVLEIGTGSGYQAAILAELAAEVVTVERHAQLSEQAAAVLAALGYGNVKLIVGDGTLGCPAAAPFDRIVVTAAGSQVPPPLFDQLADGGLIVMPLGDRGYQMLQAIRKVAGAVQVTDLSQCRFVPLVGAAGWPE